MTDPVALPPLQQQVLDEETLERLVLDIASLTEIVEVLGKAGAQSHAAPDNLQLSEAVALLRQGLLRGVQVRYRHEGKIWCDTLVRAPGGVRLTRLCLDEAECL